MKTVIQRVQSAAVRVDGEVVGSVGRGFLLLVGVEVGDTEADADATADKVLRLRCFPGRTPMDETLDDIGGGCLVVSQFTLAGSVRKGNRPSFTSAEEPARAEELYQRVADRLAACGVPVATGRFGAKMQVELVNDGPVTFLLFVRGGRVREVVHGASPDAG
ncbi:MAG: D-tyrosyl-tRNA(Tyr) deacylase [Planctomycetes bacterium]|nr:D-tyrosyl-tRNA(Tyr) deacylase [Planctomycetota bacterium]